MAIGFILVVAILVVALIILAIGWAIHRTSRADISSMPKCGACGYNLTGAPGNRCPECGALFIEAGVIPGGKAQTTVVQQRTSKAAILVALLLMTALGAGMFLTLYARNQAAAQRARAMRAQAQLVAQQAATAAVVDQLNSSILDDESSATQPASTDIDSAPTGTDTHRSSPSELDDHHSEPNRGVGDASD